MKRYLVLIAVLMLCAANVFAISAPAGLSSTNTTTTITYSWTAFDSTTKANANSVVIIDPSDSTVIATIDSVNMTSYTLTGLIPGKLYIYAVATDSAAEAFGISTPDTTTTTLLTFNLSAGTNRVTDLAFTLTARDTTGIDSLCVVTIADSELFKFYANSAVTSGNMSGLLPYTSYKLAFADGVNGNIISNPDTLVTARVDIDRYGVPRFTQGIDDSRPMRIASSSQEDAIDTMTVTLKGSSDTDSTVIYQAAKYTSFDYYVDVEDSVAFTVLVYRGYAGQNDETYPMFSLSDSLNITADGPGHKEIDFDGKCQHFFLLFRADADNAATVTARFRLNRDNR